ncbi:cell division protein FtsK [Cytobacillus praedii]|uniref:cell division protein FtsK n=1 Tax=Cytobacillus praedii TaxID=1742358 RepID=UPI002E2252C9|nr:cell division protein FtsK [Cytobacillus praedii]
MKVFKKIIVYLNKLKNIDIMGDRYEGLSAKDKEHIDSLPTQNPYGIIGLIIGAIAFAFGPKFGFIPVISLIFCIVTMFTFDKEKEDNPWPFFIGILLSIIGLYMFIKGEAHNLII